MTVFEVIRTAEKQLGMAGVEIPERTAEWLWQHVSGMDKGAWLLALQEEADEALVCAFQGCVMRRMRREPLQYILGEAEFCGQPFWVDQRVLIPRPETEILVAQALDCIAATEQAMTIVDVGTGSGAIAVSVALGVREQGLAARCRIIATDISGAALTVAQMNADRLNVSGSIEFYQGSYLSALPLDIQGISLLLSNPPYIAEGERHGLQPEVGDWEPELALYAGVDGLAAYRGLILSAKSRMDRGSSLLVEVGAGQSMPVSGLVAAAWPTAQIRTVTDQAGIGRIVHARL